MIQLNYNLVKEYTVKKLFFPYAAFQLMFVLYSNYFYEYRFIDHSWTFYLIDKSALIFLAIFASYFMQNEIR